MARLETLLQASRDAVQSHLDLSLEELFDADPAVSRHHHETVSPRV